ncbi:hypothetical protein [Corynebacterium cystitidis]|uniref:hypothetical protein n=1 Tax=Corynebacterium cystitidis TaxID=35757 RepID=UPI00211E365D|nr:hypothetical protein [Corynebacterium cystitidis]
MNDKQIQKRRPKVLSNARNRFEEVKDVLPNLSDLEPEEAAKRLFFELASLRAVRIDREHFLRTELHKAGIGEQQIAESLATTPVQAGIPAKILEKIAQSSIRFETNRSSAASFLSGLPGGVALLATVPVDTAQYFVHALRIMQKLAYVNGWQDFLEDSRSIDDETLAEIGLLIGVMMGIGGANVGLNRFLTSVAAPEVQKRVARQALTKTAWYPTLKKVLRTIGIKVTKDSVGKAVAKAVPVVGGLVSGSVTFIALRTQSDRLRKTLREVAPPGVDAPEYLKALNQSDKSQQGTTR